MLTISNVEMHERALLWIQTLAAFSGRVNITLTIGAKIVVFFHYFMLEAVSRQPCMGARWLGPVRYANLFHLYMNTTLHSLH